jgi:RNA polymerase sigma factor (sigma-70 family)
MELLKLVRQAQQGDQASFNEISRKFTGLVRKYARQAHVRAVCEEAEAEAWLAVAEAVSRYDEKSGVPVAGFIESKVKFAVWNLFKREKRRWQQEVYFGEGEDDEKTDYLKVLADSIDVAREVETKILGQEAYMALQDLPPKQRLAILRTVLEGLKLNEAAKEMGITAQAVYNLRKRGLARLRSLCHGMYRSEGGEKYGNCKDAADQQAYH